MEKRETDIKRKKKLEVSLTLNDEEVRVEFTVDLEKKIERMIPREKKSRVPFTFDLRTGLS